MQFENLFEKPVTPTAATFDRATAFKQANASQALEGLVMSEHDIVVQQRIVAGTLSSEEAIKEYVRIFATGK